MRHLLPGLLMLALAACASRPAPVEEALTPAQAACRAESKNDPAVHALGRQLNASNQQNLDRVASDIRVAELRAYRDCLRRNGLSAPGGVEARRPLR